MSHVTQPSSQPQWDHVIVLGASMAGLLAARVLSDHFRRVTLLERDALPDTPLARKGAAQSQHVHILLRRGASILNRWFPTLFPALLASGATELDVTRDLRFAAWGQWKPQFPSGITFYSQSRPLLEWQVRHLLLERPNITLLDQMDIEQLLANEDRTRVTGVAVTSRRDQQGTTLVADLIVDATGRGSQAPKWLETLGYGRVVEREVQVHVGYATRLYQRDEDVTRPWKVMLVGPAPPTLKRAGALFPIEDNRWIVTLIGWARDYPSTDPHEYDTFARTLARPEFAAALATSEPLGDIVPYRYPANRRRHYERLLRMPQRFLLVGDAVCSFNPAYGHGMTVSAMNAAALQAALIRRRATGSLEGFERDTQRAIAHAADIPWTLATSEDFRYAETVGARPPGVGLINWYIKQLHLRAANNTFATQRFYEVTHLLRPPFAMLDPRLFLAVVTGS
jgi:2-polyprenyl-6-methoxyphenol hydroxylase-like FAD-dependent oxidoreductase